jgi:hypothetical protein
MINREQAEGIARQAVDDMFRGARISAIILAEAK